MNPTSGSELAVFGRCFLMVPVVPTGCSTGAGIGAAAGGGGTGGGVYWGLTWATGGVIDGIAADSTFTFRRRSGWFGYSSPIVP